MQKKRIGIVTHYYNSNNYGGMLQAYALTYWLNKAGFDAAQICYYKRPNHAISGKSVKSSLRALKKRIIKRIIDSRKITFKKFEELIPHTDLVYDDKNIKLVNDSFDIFITGSDQVWNFNWYDENYYLSFVSREKKKLSYSASFGKKDFSENELIVLKEKLNDFDFISVRESDSKAVLEKLLNRDVAATLDPTLLLSADEWSNVDSNRFSGVHNYVFCYFLTSNKKIRKNALLFAKKMQKQIFNIPYLQNTFEPNDLLFGNHIRDVSPGDFISLIKNADYIITDSFHACAFSIIFHKPFFVYGRDGDMKMNNRINELLSLFDCSDCFLDFDHIPSNFEENISSNNYYIKKAQSEAYLLKALLD